MTRTLFAAVVLAGASLAQAQDYPTKPVQMVAPFPPGGVADIVGRPLAAAMEKSLKQPVIVVNRPGAGGAVGMASVAKAPGDGYTILMALSSISIFPVSDRINGKAPAYELKDFAPIALVTADPTVLVVAADSPWKTLEDFVATAKAHPNKMNYSSSGVYGTLHVAMEIFANAAGIKMFHVPYQGGGPAVTALLGGQVHALASGPAAAIGQIRGGKMRALASWSTERPSSCRTSRPSRSGATTRSSTSGPACSCRPRRRRRSRRACAPRCARLRCRPSSRAPWRRCRRRSTTSTRPSSRSTGSATRNASRPPCRKSARSTKNRGR
jgi:tripartite-type tricarboxylate transporter receptor subunit TctC